jgi:hypothetical protein
MTGEKTENPFRGRVKENGILPRENAAWKFPKQSLFGVEIRGQLDPETEPLNYET